MNLNTSLAQLETAQLVRRVDDPELAYQFKHALTQDSAYESLLKSDRVRVHRVVAQTYEILYADRLDEFAPIIAQHYAGADDAAKALEYSVRAGDVAARIYATTEAITHYTRALDLAKRMKAGEASLLRDLYIKRGRVLELGARNDLALENYAEMETLARERGDRAMELAALMPRATIHSIPSAYVDPVRARVLSDQALQLARELRDQPAETKILWNLLLLNARVLFHPREALAYGEQALAIARAFGMREQLAYLLNDLSILYGLLGKPEQGRASAIEARELWNEFNNLPMLADNWSSTVSLHLMAGEFEQAITASQNALRISQSIGNLWGEAYSQTWVGAAYVALGQVDQAIQSMEKAIQTGARFFPVTLVLTRAGLAELHGDLGDVTTGIELGRLAFNAAENRLPVFRTLTAGALGHVYILAGELAHAREIIQRAWAEIDSKNSNPFFDGGFDRAAAELALAEQDYARADTLLSSTLAEQQRVRMRQHIPLTLYLKSQALRGQNRLEEARLLLEKAYAEAEASGARWDLWRILAALAEIETDPLKARAWRAQARGYVQYIGDHTPPDLRESFLNLPDVRTVMEAE